MNLADLPLDGAAPAEIGAIAIERWLQVATQHSIDASAFDRTRPLEQQLAWARRGGLSIGVIFARARWSHSILEQVVESMEFAARNSIFVPSEFSCADGPMTRRRSRRVGLARALMLIAEGPGDVLLFSRLSQLCRSPFRSMNFIQKKIVEAGRRAVVVGSQLDTQDALRWRRLVNVTEVLRSYSPIEPRRGRRR